MCVSYVKYIKFKVLNMFKHCPYKYTKYQAAKEFHMLAPDGCYAYK